MIYLARITTEPEHRVELRAEQPVDTQSWLGPYTLEEIWIRLAPCGDPLARPELKSKPQEWAGSHGMKPIDFAAKYDVDSKSIILFDFAGYVGTCMTPASLWKALVFQAENGIGSLRTITRVPQLPHGPYVSPEEQVRINEEIAAFQKKLATQKPAKAVTLEDLGL